MAFTRTLLQLRTSLTRRGGFEYSADLTPVVLNELLADALNETWDILIEKWADYYTKTGTNQTIAAGTATYALPTDFYKLRKVELQIGGDWVRLYPVDIEAQHLYPSSASRPYRYRLQERNLVLVPTPAAANTYRMFYIPIRPELVADGDVVTFDVPNELKLLLAIAWRDCLDRQELDPSPAIEKIERLTKTLRTSADSRDAAEPFYLSANGPPLEYMDTLDDDWGW